MHVISIILALTLDDITVVFDFAGSICSTCVFMIFPGVAYILALRRFGTARVRAKTETMFYHALSWFLLLFGAYMFISYFTTLVMKATGSIDESPVDPFMGNTAE